jgi:tetratricopeptide (TPR) repeat protein
MAWDLLKKAYQLQMQGELEEAVRLYKQSLALCETAEAHTFLGWTYRQQGSLTDAIEECHKAIAIDPSFGNPYNDIGAYLLELGKHDEALPWLEKATKAARYESYHFAWYNLGRVYARQQLYRKAMECFRTALDIEPEYRLAEEALKRTNLLVQ